MKRLFFLAAFLLTFLPVSYGAIQPVNVSASVTDSDGQVWFGGSYQVILIRPIPGAFYAKDTGYSFAASFSGTLDNTGSFSVSLMPVSNIIPAGSVWQFTICPQVYSATCGTVQIPINSAGSISSQINAIITAPRVTGGPGVYAYSDIEVAAFPNNSYFNVTTQTNRCYSNSWTNCNSGSGGPPTGPAGGSLGGNYPNPSLAPLTNSAAIALFNGLTNCNLASYLFSPQSGTCVSSGFPIVLGATSIAANSTTTSLSGLSLIVGGTTAASYAFPLIAEGSSTTGQIDCLQTVNLSSNVRCDIRFSALASGVPVDLFDLGTDYAVNGGQNFYLKDIVTGSNVFVTQTGTDAVSFYASPTAPSPATGDNSTKLATTAWVLANATATGIMTNLGDMIYGGVGGTPTRLAGPTATQPSFLQSIGTGTTAQAPSWQGSTGSGNVVLSTSPTLVTPTLGAATATSVAFTGPYTGFNGGGTAYFIAGSASVVGSGGSYSAPACFTGVICDSSGGEVTITTGAGTLAAGTVFTVAVPMLRNYVPTNSISVKGTSTAALQPFIQFANSGGTVTATVTVDFPMSANTTYLFAWGVTNGK